MRWIGYLFFGIFIALVFVWLVIARLLSEIFEILARLWGGQLYDVQVHGLAIEGDDWNRNDVAARLGVRGSTGGGYSAGPPAQVRVMGQLRHRTIRKLKRRSDVVSVQELHRYTRIEAVREHALRLCPFITPL